MTTVGDGDPWEKIKMRRLSTMIMMLTMLVACNIPGSELFNDPVPAYERHYQDNEHLNTDYPRVPGHVPDTTKTSSTDSMCWAMVACNMLEYSGHIVDGRVCVNNLREEFGNEPGHVGAALGFYFKEYLHIKWSAPETHEYGYDIAFVMDNIDRGVPVSFSMAPSKGQPNGHVVMAFGYEVMAEDVIDLFVVDGDDNVHTTFMTLKFDYDLDYWVIHGAYDDFEFGNALALEPANN